MYFPLEVKRKCKIPEKMAAGSKRTKMIKKQGRGKQGDKSGAEQEKPPSVQERKKLLY